MKTICSYRTDAAHTLDMQFLQWINLILSKIYICNLPSSACSWVIYSHCGQRTGTYSQTFSVSVTPDYLQLLSTEWAIPHEHSTSSKLYMLCSPHNMVGMLWEWATLRQLIITICCSTDLVDDFSRESMHGTCIRIAEVVQLTLNSVSAAIRVLQHLTNLLATK